MIDFPIADPLDGTECVGWSKRYLHPTAHGGTFLVYPLITGGELFQRQNNPFSLLFFSMSLFPSLAIGAAVLRHRLRDIDLIIRQTLVYSILTVILTSIKISFLDIYRLKRSWNSCWYRCQALPNH